MKKTKVVSFTRKERGRKTLAALSPKEKFELVQRFNQALRKIKK